MANSFQLKQYTATENFPNELVTISYTDEEIFVEDLKCKYVRLHKDILFLTVEGDFTFALIPQFFEVFSSSVFQKLQANTPKDYFFAIFNNYSSFFILKGNLLFSPEYEVDIRDIEDFKFNLEGSTNSIVLSSYSVNGNEYIIKTHAKELFKLISYVDTFYYNREEPLDDTIDKLLTNEYLYVIHKLFSPVYLLRVNMLDINNAALETFSDEFKDEISNTMVYIQLLKDYYEEFYSAYITIKTELDYLPKRLNMLNVSIIEAFGLDFTFEYSDFLKYSDDLLEIKEMLQFLKSYIDEIASAFTSINLFKPSNENSGSRLSEIVSHESAFIFQEEQSLEDISNFISNKSADEIDNIIYKFYNLGQKIEEEFTYFFYHSFPAILNRITSRTYFTRINFIDKLYELLDDLPNEKEKVVDTIIKKYNELGTYLALSYESDNFHVSRDEIAREVAALVKKSAYSNIEEY